MKPYLIIAFYHWALDNNITPILEVVKNSLNIIPKTLQNKEVMFFSLNLNCVRKLVIGKEIINFEAYFQGDFFQVSIPISSVRMIFNDLDGKGISFNQKTNFHSINKRFLLKEDYSMDKSSNKQFILVKSSS